MDIIRHKQALKALVPSSVMAYAVMRRAHPEAGILEVLRRSRLVRGGFRRDAADAFVRQSARQYEIMELGPSGFYAYPFDPWVARVVRRGRAAITSVTPDYSAVLRSSLSGMESALRRGPDCAFARRELGMIACVRRLAARVSGALAARGDARGRVLAGYLRRIPDGEPRTLDEAVQKLLFYNALFWQAGHWQCGLGRLDMVLAPYYERDLASGTVTREGAKELLRRMCLVLGRDMKAKSRALAGDTGQYILLGGVGRDGATVQNGLTEMFLEVVAELGRPDPKLILRVNASTSAAVWEKAVGCILTGCGSPLLVNEGLVMRGMEEFGYAAGDVWNFGTSACWEPLVIGKSFDQNNPLLNIPVVESLNGLVAERPPAGSFAEFLDMYKRRLRRQVLGGVRDVPFDCSPLYSLFFDDCMARRADFSEGGARYAYHGVQVVGFPNLVNALLNIKVFVYDRGLYTLDDCAEALRSDFRGREEMRVVLLSNPLKFGGTDGAVVGLTRALMSVVSDAVSGATMNGNKAKVGFSSSHYVIMGRGSGASLDGRRAGEPFAVHISPVSSGVGLQEVLDFAGSLDYSGNRMNGNVVDFVLPPSYARVPDKLAAILRHAMSRGVYELQLNVLDAAALREAKAHPERHPGLIVRVWGFSAYFNDLPEEYKDTLIRRAEAYA